jgi:hypothetical protein
MPKKVKRYKMEQEAANLVKDHRFYFYEPGNKYSRVNRRLKNLRKAMFSLGGDNYEN